MSLKSTLLLSFIVQLCDWSRQVLSTWTVLAYSVHNVEGFKDQLLHNKITNNKMEGDAERFDRNLKENSEFVWCLRFEYIISICNVTVWFSSVNLLQWVASSCFFFASSLCVINDIIKRFHHFLCSSSFGKISEKLSQKQRDNNAPHWPC